MKRPEFEIRVFCDRADEVRVHLDGRLSDMVVGFGVLVNDLIEAGIEPSTLLTCVRLASIRADRFSA